MPPLTPNIPLSEQVATHLRSLLSSGGFPVGSRIPTEAELSADLGVSRNSVREAVRALVHAGLLQARAGSGTYVVATSDLAPALARHVEHDAPNDTAEVRLILEREAARLAARRATPEGVATLRELLARRDGSLGTDVAFHQHLVALSGNALLSELYRGIGGVEEAHERMSPADGAVVRHADVDEAHAAITAAIERGDADAAAAAVTANVRLLDAHASRGGGR